MLIALSDTAALALAGLPAQIPDVGPTEPPGAEQLTEILGYMRWLALGACGLGFAAGIVAFTAGRVIDNRRFGTTGTMMMLASVGGALLFGIGPAVLNGFAGTPG